MQGQHYTMALIDRVYDAGRVIERLLDVNSDLCQEVEELKSRPGPEAVIAAKRRASDLEKEVNRMKAKLKENRARVQTLDDELLTLSQDVKSTRSASWAAEEALKEERLHLPDQAEERLR
ncbi:hypothetical protein C4D60_Mb10t26800 [Musa balbisiana]|uniref:Uncharacterized protein n=1 Tax=Musa balbisiana TaxID=52838 RepID=A0A4S8IZZ8_MUSBA|nr:hypothetical protein C4D60_Mb10t26800 [Musa balbisiana]